MCVCGDEGNKEDLFQDSSGDDMDEEEHQVEVDVKEIKMVHLLEVMAQNYFLQRYSSSYLT